MWLFSGCASPEPASPGEEPVIEPPGELVSSSLQRSTPSDVTAGELASVVSGNTDLGAALYRQAVKPGQNLFLSPFSVTQALAMIYGGARGNTETQMGQALRFSLPQARFHPAMNALDQTLQSRAANAQGQNGPPPELRVLNTTWGQKGLTFEPAFLDGLAQHYGAGMRVVDFAQESEPIRVRINEWVESSTKGLIRELLPEDTVNGDTRLVLTNVLYFKGRWSESFEPERTHDAPFHLLDGGVRQVKTMVRSGIIPRMRGEGFDALALPYKGGAFRMLLVVPDSGRFADVESRLSEDFLAGVRQALAPRFTALRMPRFQVETTLPLKDSLEALGMVDAFSSAADFSGLTSQERLRIAFVQHKAFVSVDEAGTEAGAATAVGAVPVSVPEPFAVNRPFLFLIEDVETKAVLFLGRLVNPP
jgi:serpin B